MESASPAAANPGSEVSFAVAYQDAQGGAPNPDLYEKGTFTARADATYRFTGRRRALVGGETVTLEFAAGDIANVDSLGRTVWFTTPKGRAGAQKNPFVFHCRDDAEARVVVRLLPAKADAGFVRAEDFRAKLARVSPARSPYLTVTNAILALTVAVFVVMAGFLGAGWLGVARMEPYIRYGANHGAVTTNGGWWRLLASVFLHYGALHLAFNMWALFQSGQLLERLQGRGLYLVTYLGSGVGGGLLSLAWHAQKPVWSAGASGAVFGVYGAMLGFMLRERQAVPRAIFDPMVRSTFSFAVYNLVFGAVFAGIDNAAHVGGFATGALLGWLTALPLEVEVRRRRGATNFLTAAAVLAAIGAAGYFAAPRFN